MSSSRSSAVSGFWYGLAAYFSWGFFPIYFKAVKAAPPVEVLAHRIVWSTLFLLGLVFARGRLKRGAFASGVPLRPLLLTTLLLSSNWLLYIWAVSHDRVVEASLGYFITPLMNVLLGMAFLRERLNRAQAFSVLLAAGGVTYLTLAQGYFPLISLLLGVSFALYGLVRKRAGIEPTLGLLAETSLLAPLALAYLGWLAWSGQAHWSEGHGRLLGLLALSGAMTSMPLIWFNQAGRLLPLSTLGLMQYLSPIIQLLCGVLLYGEPFTRAYAVTFVCIWASLAVFTADVLRRARSQKRLEPAPERAGAVT